MAKRRKSKKHDKSRDVPIELLKAAIAAIDKKYDTEVDSWDNEEHALLRATVGSNYDHISDHELRNQCQRRVRKAKKTKEPEGSPWLSPEYKAHLKSEVHLEMVKEIIALRNGLCVGCAAPATECHHNRYRPEVWGTPYEADDMVPVCRRCHKVLDRRRRTQAEDDRLASMTEQLATSAG